MSPEKANPSAAVAQTQRSINEAMRVPVGLPHSDAVIAAAAACSGATNWEAVVVAIGPVLSALGFPYFSVLEAVAVGDRIALQPLMGQYQTRWRNHYDSTGLAAVDPRLRRARQSARDLFWTEILRDDPDLSEAERAFLAEAARFDLRESYVLPYRTAAGRVFASVLIGQGAEINPVYRVMVRMLGFELVTSVMRLTAISTHQARNASVRLSPRQLQCLAWIREGKSSGDIATVLGISARTVDGHVAELLKALGVRTRVQAVSKAISIGLLT